ncbi:pentatricopeptide repeat-containing protein At4g22760 [Cannabis sativa]|uniref:pentatricopeptide repeat-containing protein At4g22760 n=1 Tax=Cannabis sativa TaxID=3483 RepID=UPI0029C9F85B|nr:pentatricopeptide repeat-containing protein At4g22760 [Cannabis sativa]
MVMIKKLTFLLTHARTIDHLRKIHSPIITHGLTQLETLLANQLLLLTTQFSRNIAQYITRILHHLQNPDAHLWSFAVRFFSHNGQFNTALSLYVEMLRLGLCPSSFALSSSLKACAKIGDRLSGCLVHSHVYKYGFCGSVYVETAVLDFYSKSGDMVSARKVFDEMPERNVVSWNAVLSGYLRFGNLKEAQKVFVEIPCKDVVSWNSMISGYARTGDMDRAISLFEEMPEKNLASWNTVLSGYVSCGCLELAGSYFVAMPVRNNVSWITMISGYSKCGDVASARLLFDQIKRKELLSFNAMIACYEQNNQPKEALELFNHMVKTDFNIQPDEMTLTSVVSACSQLGYLEFGLWIESYMKKNGIRLDDHLANSFIDLYAKCGNIEKAFELFRGLRNKDLVAYSAMISGFGVNGKAIEAIELFKEMKNDHISPNLVTYKGLLSAYNHAGLVEEGYKCFDSMKEQGLLPSVDHYGIMVDLLGRGGLLKEAHELIKTMPMQPHAGVWGALLLACRIHNNVELGEIAARNCLKLQPEKAGYSSLLANIYASAERWNDAGRLRNVLDSKIPGCSWVESC